jgi:hypothetical protein
VEVIFRDLILRSPISEEDASSRQPLLGKIVGPLVLIDEREKAVVSELKAQDIDYPRQSDSSLEPRIVAGMKLQREPWGSRKSGFG